MLRVLVLLLLLGTVGFADPTPAPTYPKVVVLELNKRATVQGVAGRIVRLSLPLKDKSVATWQVEAGDDTADFAESMDGKAVLFNCPDPGSYRLRYYVLEDGKGGPIVEVTVVLVARVPPAPPGPKPDEDALYAPLLAAYQKETGVTKSVVKVNLAAGYRSISDALGSIKTAGDLAIVIGDVTKRQVADQLPLVRDVIGEDFAKQFKMKDADTLTDDQRKAISTQLVRYARLLESLP